MIDLDISRLQQRAYRRALRDAVGAVKARCSSDGEFMCVECEVSVAAIEALGGER